MAKKKRARKDGGGTVGRPENGGSQGSFNASAVLPVPPTLTFDSEKYRAHVAHFDMDEDGKVELLRAVWLIMQSFVDRAFGDDSAQHVSGGGDHFAAKDEMALASVVDFEAEKNPDMPDDLTACFQRQAGIPGDGEESIE